MLNFRSPSVIRLVTCSVLLISDLDVIFSLLFIWNVATFDTLVTNFLIFVVVVGLLTYTAAVSYFGPKNKFKTMKNVRHMMVAHRDLFQIAASSGSPPKFLDDAMAVNQNQSGAHPSFQDLELTTEGRNQFQAGLASYGLPTIWTYADAQNAKNVCECKHGIPFFRLANFAFHAAPTARDLAGILNANSAYTFCTGFPQLAIGGYLVSLMGWPLPVQTILPLLVSFLSLVLSACNVLLDFSRILTEIDEEQRISDNLESESKTRLDEDKAKLEVVRRRKVDAAPRTYENSQKTPHDKALMNNAIESADAEYDIDANKLNSDNVQRLVVELQMHRDRLQKISNAKRGSLPRNIRANTTLASERYAQCENIWDDLIARKAAVFKEETHGLDVNSPDYVAQLVEINRRRDVDINMLSEEKMKELRAFGAAGLLHAV